MNRHGRLGAAGVRMLVATAVEPERIAVLRGLSISDDVEDAERDITVRVVGVGPARSAATTSRILAQAEAAGRPYRIVVSAGIGGGFPGRAELGAMVIGTRSVAADLGADGGPDGFLPLDRLGLGTSFVDSDAEVVARLRIQLPAAIGGEVLSVSTVTGTAARAADLAGRHPLAVAEGMEGFGVGIAAVLAEVAFVEIRTIANPVGPRDRDAWRIDDALAALAIAASALEPVLAATPPG